MSLEYSIRKLERGLRVLIMQRKRGNNSEEVAVGIQDRAVLIARYKKALYLLTGKCTPSSAKWPL